MMRDETPPAEKSVAADTTTPVESGSSDSEIELLLDAPRRPNFRHRLVSLEESEDGRVRTAREIEASVAGKQTGLSKARVRLRDTQGIERAGLTRAHGGSSVDEAITIAKLTRELHSEQRALQRARISEANELVIAEAYRNFEAAQVDLAKGPREKTVALLVRLYVEESAGRPVRRAILDTRAHLARMGGWTGPPLPTGKDVE